MVLENNPCKQQPLVSKLFPVYVVIQLCSFANGSLSGSLTFLEWSSSMKWSIPLMASKQPKTTLKPQNATNLFPGAGTDLHYLFNGSSHSTSELTIAQQQLRPHTSKMRPRSHNALTNKNWVQGDRSPQRLATHLNHNDRKVLRMGKRKLAVLVQFFQSTKIPTTGSQVVRLLPSRKQNSATRFDKLWAYSWSKTLTDWLKNADWVIESLCTRCSRENWRWMLKWGKLGGTPGLLIDVLEMVIPFVCWKYYYCMQRRKRKRKTGKN